MFQCSFCHVVPTQRLNNHRQLLGRLSVSLALAWMVGCGSPVGSAPQSAANTNAGSLLFGQAAVGDTNEVAHIDLIIGDKRGAAGSAFASAFTAHSDGHPIVIAALERNVAVRPVTILVPKVTIKHAIQSQHLFGPVKEAIAAAVVDSIEQGLLSAAEADQYVIVCSVLINWESADEKALYKNNYDAMTLAMRRALRSSQSLDEIKAFKSAHPSEWK